MSRTSHQPHDPYYDEYRERLQSQIRKRKGPLLDFDPLSQLPPWLEHPEKLSSEAIAYANKSPWYHIQIENARRDPNSPLYSQHSSQGFSHERNMSGELGRGVVERQKRNRNAGYEGDDEEDESEEWQGELLYASGSTNKSSNFSKISRRSDDWHSVPGPRDGGETQLIMSIGTLPCKRSQTRSAELKREKYENQEPLYISWNPGEDEKKTHRSQNEEAMRYEVSRRKGKADYSRIERISKSQEVIADERNRGISGKGNMVTALNGDEGGSEP